MSESIEQGTWYRRPGRYFRCVLPVSVTVVTAAMVGCGHLGPDARPVAGQPVITYGVEAEELRIELSDGTRVTFLSVPSAAHLAVRCHPDPLAYLYASFVRDYPVRWEHAGSPVASSDGPARVNERGEGTWQR